MRSAKFTNVLHIAQTPSKKMMGFSATRLRSLSATMASMAFLRVPGDYSLGWLSANAASIAPTHPAQNASSPFSSEHHALWRAIVMGVIIVSLIFNRYGHDRGDILPGAHRPGEMPLHDSLLGNKLERLRSSKCTRASDLSISRDQNLEDHHSV